MLSMTRMLLTQRLHAHLFIAMILISVINSIAGLISPFAISKLLSSMTSSLHTVIVSAIEVLLVGIVACVGRYFSNVVRTQLVNSMVTTLRVNVAHNLAFGTVDLETVQHGDVTTRILTDSATLVTSGLSLLDIALGVIVSLVGICILSMQLNLEMSVVMSIYMVVYVLLPILFRKVFYRVETALRENQSDALNWNNSLVGGLDITRFFSNVSADWVDNVSRRKWDRLNASQLRGVKWSGLLAFLQQFVNTFLICVLVFVGVFLQKGHHSSLEVTLAFVLYADKFRGVATTAGQTTRITTRIRVSLERLQRLLVFSPFKIPISSYSSEHVLVFQGVSLSVGKRFLLHGEITDIPQYGTIVITGQNGGGKTTLLRSLIGLVQPSAGMIEWNKKIEPELISYIPQTVPVFEVSLYENIALGKGISRTAVVDLLKSIGWQGAINLDDEYSVYRQPSGGQRKRIGVARALITRPQIIIADEPEAGIDNVSRIVTMLKNSCDLVIVASHTPEIWDPNCVISIADQSIIQARTISGSDILENAR